MEDSSDLRNPVERLAEDYLQRRRRGEKPTLEEYLEKHPEWSGEIRELFPTLLLIEEARRDTTGGQPTPCVIRDHRKFERFGDYRILKKIGEGGMGTVFEAEQLSLGRHVALKVLTPRFEGQLLERFLQESRAAARLHHTNIVPVFGVGEEAGIHYYVMQFITGLGLEKVLAELQRMHKNDRIDYGQTESLSNRSAWVAGGLLSGKFSLEELLSSAATWGNLEVPLPAGQSEAESLTGDGITSDSGSVSFPGDKPLSSVLKSNGQYFRSVAQIGVQVADALVYAHAQGTLHRDIKPSNLILDHHGRIWVTDFGLAKLVQEGDLTEQGDIVGTLRYMAPERFKGRSEPACDVYGLGLTLYELIALRPAFDARDRSRLIQQITEGRMHRLSRIRPEVPADLERIITKAVEPEPDYRYRNAKELGHDLRNFLEDRPISIKRALPTERLWRLCRRNPLVASLTLAIVILMIAITVGSIHSVHRLRQEQHARSRELADKVLTAPSVNVPYIIQALQASSDTGWRDLALPRLRELLAEESAQPALKLRAAVALTLLGEPHRESLIAAIRTAPAHECGNIARALREARGETVEPLLEVGRSEEDPVTRARIALVLLGLGDATLTREMLAGPEDPRLRTTFIRQAGLCKPDLSSVPELLVSCEDPSFRSAVCAALGTIEVEALPVHLRSRIERTLLHLYRSAPSGATHGAAAWALTRWKVPLPELDPSRGASTDRDWFVNSLGMHMIRVPSGFLALGDLSSSSAPSRPVYLTRPFFMMDREVSVELFTQFLDDRDYPRHLKPREKPAHDTGVSVTGDCPMQNIRLSDAILFCNWLSYREGRDPCYERVGENRWRCRFEGDGYRLPTEAEWEHACRAGTRTAYLFGEEVEWITDYANVSSHRAQPGGRHLPNGWGFFDLIGNVWERCWDSHYVPYPESPPQTSLIIDPIGITDDVGADNETAIRGGGIGSSFLDYRSSARRSGVSAASRLSDTGFRVVCCDDSASAEDLVARMEEWVAGDAEKLPDCWRALRRWYTQHEQLEEGEARLGRALQAYPDDAQLRAEHGILLTASCRFDEAAEKFERAFESGGRKGSGLFESSWWVAGLYREDLRESFPPETESEPCLGEGANVFWRPALPSDGDLLQLDALFGLLPNISVYALTHVYSVREQDATLLVGSDDQVRVWVNDELVHEHADNRMAIRDDDHVPVKLRAGWNKVLAKVVNHTVGYVLYLRFSADPVLCAGAYGSQGRWEDAEAVLSASIESGSGEDPELLLSHARTLACLFRWQEASDEFRRALESRTTPGQDFFQSGWWVVGPYPNDLQAEFPPESDPDPSRPAGNVDDGEPLQWRATGYRQEEGYLSLGSLANCRGESSTAYAITDVYSLKEQDVTLLIGAEHRAIIWLNGNRVHEYPEFFLPWRAVPVQDRVNVTLQAGWNRIHAKVSHAYGAQKISIRLSTDPLERARARNRTGEVEEKYARAIRESYARPGDPRVWVRLGHLLGELGEWEKATYAFSRAIEMGSPVDSRRCLLLTHLARDNAREASIARGELLLSFTASRPDPTDLSASLWSCVLFPDQHSNRGLLTRLALRCVRAGNDHLGLTVLGAVHYRAGRYDEALRNLRDAEKLAAESPHPPAYTWYFLALTLSRRDRPSDRDEARTWTEKAIRWTEDAFNSSESPAAREGASFTWVEKLSLQLLRREAEALRVAEGLAGE